jgi:hypothetical protein
MSNPMREQLIGYLLKAVEPDEHRQVEEHLAKDESLRGDLKVLEWGLHPLSADQSHHEPPKGLAQRCCQFVYSRTEVMPVALSPAGTIGGTVNQRRWSWLDLSVAGAIAVAVAVLLVPAIYQSNANARMLACQNNLKDIGLATASYSDRHDGYYPAAQPGERIDYAGKWAPLLKTQNYLTQAERSVVCPSSQLAEDRQFHVPTVAELQDMNEAQLAGVLARLSGSYGETLGYNDGYGYKVQRKPKQARPSFAVASDAPGEHAANSPNHGGQGQNVLFEDGSVKYLTTSRTANGDDIFRNAHNQLGPGDNIDDAVIAPAYYRPQ